MVALKFFLCSLSTIQKKLLDAPLLLTWKINQNSDTWLELADLHEKPIMTLWKHEFVTKQQCPYEEMELPSTGITQT